MPFTPPPSRTRSAGSGSLVTSGGDVDEDLADGAVLHRLVRSGGLGQWVDVQRQPGVDPDPHCTVEYGGVDVLDADVLGAPGLGVDQYELPAGVGRHLGAHRDGHLGATVVGVHADGAVHPDDLRVDRGVHRGVDLDDRVDPVRGDLPDLGDDVLLLVVDDVVGAGLRGQLRLVRAADGGDH